MVPLANQLNVLNRYPDMPYLPLFPLQLVVYPGESLNLHIFEPRYRQLIADAEAHGTRFGVPTVIEGELKPLATEVELYEVTRRYDSGESDVKTRGGRIFRIEHFDRESPDRLYPGGVVSYLEDPLGEDRDMNREIVKLTRWIYRQLNIDREVRPADQGFTTYEIAHYVGLSLEQEYELLSLTQPMARQEYLLTHLRTIRPQVGDPLGIKARARLNGHFKDLKPPDF